VLLLSGIGVGKQYGGVVQDPYVLRIAVLFAPAGDIQLAHEAVIRTGPEVLLVDHAPDVKIAADVLLYLAGLHPAGLNDNGLGATPAAPAGEEHQEQDKLRLEQHLPVHNPNTNPLQLPLLLLLRSTLFTSLALALLAHSHTQAHAHTDEPLSRTHTKSPCWPWHLLALYWWTVLGNRLYAAFLEVALKHFTAQVWAAFFTGPQGYSWPLTALPIVCFAPLVVLFLVSLDSG